jgi:hypothetical protein
MTDGENGSSGGGILTRLGAVERDVAGLAAGVQALRTDIGRIAMRLDERSSKPWPIIISGVALALTIGGLAVTVLQREIDANARYDEQAGVARDRRADQFERSMADAIVRFDQTLQREMRDLDAGLQSQVTQLRSDLEALGEDVDAIPGETFGVGDFQTFLHPLLAELSDRVRAVETDRSGVVLAGRHEDLESRVADAERELSAQAQRIADAAAQADLLSRALSELKRNP